MVYLTSLYLKESNFYFDLKLIQILRSNHPANPIKLLKNKQLITWFHGDVDKKCSYHLGQYQQFYVAWWESICYNTTTNSIGDTSHWNIHHYNRMCWNHKSTNPDRSPVQNRIVCKIANNRRWKWWTVRPIEESEFRIRERQVLVVNSEDLLRSLTWSCFDSDC